MNNVIFYRNLISFKTDCAHEFIMQTVQTNSERNKLSRDVYIKHNKLKYLTNKFDILNLLKSRENEFVSKLAATWLPSINERYPDEMCIAEGYFADIVSGVHNIFSFMFKQNVMRVEIIYVNTYTNKVDYREYIIGNDEKVVAKMFIETTLSSVYLKHKYFKNSGYNINVSTRSTIDVLEKFTYLVLKYDYETFSLGWTNLIGNMTYDNVMAYAKQVGLVIEDNQELIFDKDFDKNAANRVPDFVKDLFIEKLKNWWSLQDSYNKCC